MSKKRSSTRACSDVQRLNVRRSTPSTTSPHPSIRYPAEYLTQPVDPSIRRSPNRRVTSEALPIGHVLPSITLGNQSVPRSSSPGEIETATRISGPDSSSAAPAAGNWSRIVPFGTSGATRYLASSSRKGASMSTNASRKFWPVTSGVTIAGSERGPFVLGSDPCGGGSRVQATMVTSTRASQVREGRIVTTTPRATSWFRVVWRRHPTPGIPGIARWLSAVPAGRDQPSTLPEIRSSRCGSDLAGAPR